MKKYFQKLKQLPRNYQIIGGVVVLFLIIISFFYLGRGSASAEYSVVKKSTITQEVVVTGKTEAVDHVELAFEKSGKIASAPVAVGQKVVIGQTLAALDASDLNADLERAMAGVASAQAKMDEIKKGARTEDVKITESELETVKTNLADAERGLLNAIQDAYVKMDDAVYRYTDTFFDNPKTTNAIINFPTSDPNLKIYLSAERRKLEKTFQTWKIDIVSKQDNLRELFAESQKNLLQAKNFIDALSVPINDFTTYEYTVEKVTTDKATIATARTNINNAISDLSTAYEKYNTAKSSTDTLQRQLDLKIAKPTTETLIQQQALVDQAEAEYFSVLSQIAKTRIVAPISGLVTKFDVKLGEISSPNVNVVNIIAPNNLEITANVPEVDIGKIKVGDPVVLSYDAFPGEEFTGKVSYTEPAETIIDGIVNYKIKVQPIEKDERIKSGLTANLIIQTMSKNDVLALPDTALVKNDNGVFVQKVTGQDKTLVPVAIGVRGQNGLVEILSGVKEGDKVTTIGTKSE